MWRQMDQVRWVIGVVITAVFLYFTIDSASAMSTHTVRHGETLSSIAIQYDMGVTELAQLNNINNHNLIYVGQVLRLVAGESSAPVANGGQSYTVQVGDSLYAIALRFDITVEAIQATNNIINPSQISVGQVLWLPNGVPQPTTPPTTNVPYKRIVVDLSEQRAYTYENGNPVHYFVVSTGQPGSDTWTGTYYIETKLPNAYAKTWDLQMPNWLGFYWAGSLQNGFHALPILPNGEILWDGYLGTPVSYGCVILSYVDSQTLYDWAEYGTEVIVQP